MSLDLVKVAPQIEGMAAGVKSAADERGERLRRALQIIGQGCDVAALGKKADASRTSWLVAGLTGELDQHPKPPPPPGEFNVIASDGSHIDVDRHQSPRCCLINIGSAVLSYGARPHAILDSSPSLYFREEDLVITPQGAAGRGQPVEGVLLGVKRGVEELRTLAGLAAGMPPASSTLALLDGSLILWGLAGQAFPEFVADVMFRDFTAQLDTIRKAGGDKKTALASYISLPRSTDVVNVLRLAICPHEVADCEHHCTSRECDAISGVQDRELFFNTLAPGERSALFFSRSSVVQKYYGEHCVHFFYLRVEDEIARVEVPQWVAQDEDRLNLAHALTLDQCRRGHGYPVALSEAHERAVVTGADRQLFWQMVETSFAGEHLPTPTSAKSFSKRTRWI